MRKPAATQLLQFAKTSILEDISRLYTQRLEEVAAIVEECRSDEARFSFIVELSMSSPSISIVRMRFIKQHVYLKRTVIQNPDQLDALQNLESSK